jgi:hypothetical protein
VAGAQITAMRGCGYSNGATRTRKKNCGDRNGALDTKCHDPLGDLKIIGAEQGRIGRFRERGRRTEPEVDEEDSRTEEMNSVIFQLSSTVPIGGLISFATVLLHGPSPIQQSWPKAHKYI